MALTVSLVHELRFISCALKTLVKADLALGNNIPINVLVDNNTLFVAYKGNNIWREKITGPTAFFGVESCDSISRIISCIDNGTDWQKYSFFEKT